MLDVPPLKLKNLMIARSRGGSVEPLERVGDKASAYLSVDRLNAKTQGKPQEVDGPQLSCLNLDLTGRMDNSES
jgi:hypothetical protein